MGSRRVRGSNCNDSQSRRLRIFEDQRRRLGMTACGFNRDRRAQSNPIEDDRRWGKMARVGEVAPGGIRILVGACLRGMDVYALPKAAIIEGKNIDAQLVQGLQLRQRVRERSRAVMQQEQGIGGVGCAGDRRESTNR